MHQDHVTLIVPAKGEFAKTVRMTAAALVARTNMTYDDVEDVRMAAEEAFVYAIDILPPDSPVRFEFAVSDDVLEIDVGLGSELPPSEDGADRSVAYAVFILESVCDENVFESDENGAHLHLVKRAGSGDAD